MRACMNYRVASYATKRSRTRGLRRSHSHQTGSFWLYGGGTSLFAYSFRLHTTYTVSSLPGFNQQPDWLQGGSNPCLLFTNMQTAISQIYLACLIPRVAWAPVTQGAYPEWLGG